MWKSVKFIVWSVVVIILGGAVYWAMREQPIAVDLAETISAPMTVTVQEEGTTRVRDVFTVSAPIAGRLNRIKLDEGQSVKANETLIASIHPLDPPFIDERSRLEIAAAITASKYAVTLAEVEYERAKVALKLAQSEYDRTSVLAKKRILPLSQLEKSFNTLELQKAQVTSAQAAIELRKAELEKAEAQLQQPQTNINVVHSEACCMQIRSPIDGVILKLFVRSQQPVASGAQIAEVGDPNELEIIIDVLSKDAAFIQPGARVEISDWGQPEVLTGVVRRIDPAAFTKVSSLGIEEQRVNIIVDLVDRQPTLGHGFRVVGDFVIWQGEDVLQIPIGALFRSEGNWAAFVAKEGTAELRTLKIGKLNRDTAQVLSGLESGDTVILYPNDTLENGSLIKRREKSS